MLRIGKEKANERQEWKPTVLLFATGSWDAMGANRFFANAQNDGLKGIVTLMAGLETRPTTLCDLFMGYYRG